MYLPGHGPVSIVPTGWADLPDAAKPGKVEIGKDGTLLASMDARAYFAERCTGRYNHTDYIALQLLNKRLQFSVDLAGAGCGCNAAFYLVSMKQNPKESMCSDYYCDANSVCGVACDEIDIMEANQHAFHSTLHTLHDNSGVGGGFGGGGPNWNGPRDFTAEEYGLGGRCVDTARPFQVAVEFPIDLQGNLKAMDITLAQAGSDCDVHFSVAGYSGLQQLTEALQRGMTPTFSYWRAADMLWMDGVGADGQGPCDKDTPQACGDSVRMYGFEISAIQEHYGQAVAPSSPSPAPPSMAFIAPGSTATAAPSAPPLSAPSPAPPSVTTVVATTTVACSITRKADCSASHCCADPGMQCYEKNEYWAACQLDCHPGLDLRDASSVRSPWTCRKLGSRTPGLPLTTTTTPLPVVSRPQPGNSSCARAGASCAESHCCYEPGMQCYLLQEHESACLATCDKADQWTCMELGARTLGHPAPTTTAAPSAPQWIMLTVAPTKVPSGDRAEGATRQPEEAPRKSVDDRSTSSAPGDLFGFPGADILERRFALASPRAVAMRAAQVAPAALVLLVIGLLAGVAVTTFRTSRRTMARSAGDSASGVGLMTSFEAV